jgi:hypothetical protein
MAGTHYASNSLPQQNGHPPSNAPSHQQHELQPPPSASPNPTSSKKKKKKAAKRAAQAAFSSASPDDPTGKYAYGVERNGENPAGRDGAGGRGGGSEEYEEEDEDDHSHHHHPHDNPVNSLPANFPYPPGGYPSGAAAAATLNGAMGAAFGGVMSGLDYSASGLSPSAHNDLVQTASELYRESGLLPSSNRVGGR